MWSLPPQLYVRVCFFWAPGRTQIQAKCTVYPVRVIASEGIQEERCGIPRDFLFRIVFSQAILSGQLSRLDLFPRAKH